MELRDEFLAWLGDGRALVLWRSFPPLMAGSVTEEDVKDVVRQLLDEQILQGSIGESGGGLVRKKQPMWDFEGDG